MTNPDGGNASKTFTVTVNPINVTGRTRPSVTLLGSTKNFTINGTGFMTGATVKLDGTTVSAETSITSTAITLTLGSFPAVGTHTFTVTNPDGGNASKTFVVTVNPLSFATGPDPSTPTNKTFTLTGGTFRSGATVKLDGSSSNIASAVVNSTTQMNSDAHNGADRG